MNTRFLSVAVAVCTVAVYGCGASTKSGGTAPPTDSTPNVSATANITSGIAPLAVEFTGVAAGGNGALSYSWDFGDGETAEDQNANHVYGAAGSFNAKFTATDEDGDFASATVLINVGTEQLPAVTAAADVTQGLAPLDVQFVATVVGGNTPVTVAWNFGDGETSAELTPMHTFTTPGSYGATVTATDATGDTAQATVLIVVGNDAIPVVAVSANPLNGPAPLNVTFTGSVAGGNLPLTFAWSFGDGGSANTQNSAHTYTANGSFQAKLTVTDADGDSAAANVTIVVNDAQGSMLPDLQIGTFDVFANGLVDAYEPNGTRLTARALGGYVDSPIAVNDGYIDETDVTWEADIVNFGKAQNTPFYVDFYRHAPSGPAAFLIGDDWESVPSLGENATQRLYFTFFDVQPDETMNSYVRVDTDDDIEETVETNNLTTALNSVVLPDEDWYSVYQDIAGNDVSVSLASLPFDYDIEVYDKNGVFLDDSANAGTTAESVVVAAPSVGNIYIRVFGYNGTRSSSDSYQLGITIE